ncbi:3663_t:CDS:2, partial [Entrophospora sp. SA101]
TRIIVDFTDDSSLLSNHSFGHTDCTEITRPIEEDECCFLLQIYNVVSSIFMFLLLNTVYGVAFGIILFPTHDHNNNSNEQLFGAYKYIGMTMFFTRAEIIEEHLASAKSDYVVCTILFAYALSAILTGVGLLLFVRFKLRFLLDIFPKHIYNGVLGSIGSYLVWTAIKISVQNSESFDYNYRVFFHKNNLLLFALASILASSLAVFVRHEAKNNYVPITTLSILSIFSSFYFIKHFWSISLESLIENGWIFALDNQITISEFYSNFYFRLISWGAIGKTISTMLTLIFFMMLSTHIKITEFEASIYGHQIDIDHELIVQGASNLISGIFFGHFQ